MKALSHFLRRAVSLLLAAACVFVAACGKPEVSGSPSGKADDSPAFAPVSAKPIPNPYQDISSTLVEKEGVLPLGYFAFKFGDVERQCMGSYVGGGRFLTAAHCFSGIVGLPLCPPSLRVQWLKSNGQSYQLSGDATACESVRSIHKEGDDAVDVAIVKLASLGTWPASALSIHSSAGVISKKVKMIGPQGSGSSLYFRAFVGEPLEYSGNFIHHNAPHKSGYSGSPLFAQVDGGAPIDFNSAAVGLHVGMASGAVRAQKGEVILEHLNEVVK